MSDNDKLVSRRTALRGIASVAGVSAAGMGSVRYASEPAAADVQLPIDIQNLDVFTTDGELSALGISDMWFELSWNRVPDDIILVLELRSTDISEALFEMRSSPRYLGVTGTGSETYGFGETYAEEYEVDLATLDYETPFVASRGDDSLIRSGTLDEFSMGEGEGEEIAGAELTSFEMSFGISCFSASQQDDAADVVQGGDNLIGGTGSYFTLSVIRNVGEVEAEGEAIPVGED
jgi:hypothetical protein